MAMSRGIRATQSNKDLVAALKKRQMYELGSLVVRPGTNLPGKVVGIGDESLFVKWPGSRVVELAFGRDDVYAVDRFREV